MRTGSSALRGPEDLERASAAAATTARHVRPWAVARALAAAFAVAVGLVVVARWLLGSMPLASSARSVSPQAALAFVAAGVSLLLPCRRTEQSARARTVAAVAAAAVVAAGVSSLARPDAMAPLEALDFVLVGAALLAIRFETRRAPSPVAQRLVLPVVATSALALVVRAFGVEAAAPIVPYVTMPPIAAGAFLALSAGVAAAHPYEGAVAFATSETAGAIVARRLVPVAVAVPIFVAWVALEGERAGLYRGDLRAALVAIVNAAAYVGLVWSSVRVIDRIDSDRAAARAGMLDREERFRRLIEAAPDSIILTDRRGRISFANAQTERLFGYSRDELRGRRVEALMPARFRGAHVEHRGDFAAHPRSRPMGAGPELFGLRKDGTEFSVEISLSPMDGTDTTVATVRDVTARKHVAAELRASEERARQLIEAAPDAVVVVDDRGRITLVNSQTEALFGYSREDLVGQRVEKLIPSRFRDKHLGHREGYSAHPRTRPMGAGLDLYGLRADGSEFPVEISLSPVQGPEGTTTIATVRDVTDRKRAEQALREQKERAEAANRELEAFSYAVSHDLRAPLRGIDGFSSALLEDYGDKLDAQGQEYLQRMRAAAKRMADLIDDLLLLSRAARVELRVQRVDVTLLSRAVIADLARAEPGRAVEWIVHEGLATRGDPHLIRLVLENLIGNAFKFTAKRTAGVRIEIGAEARGGSTVFFVRDNGAGFDMTYADKLFSPFQRLHTAAEFPGSGIGLATVQRIVRRHGGRVWAQAQPGAGATFYFTIGEPGGKGDEP